MQEADIFKALANPRRLQILDWLKDPVAHFPRQVDGDLVEDGVCALLIADKLGITPATLSEHMRVLSQSGLVRSRRIKQWIFYQRNEDGIGAVRAMVLESL
ncbi:MULTISPECIES: ArsR/SmtB family transcription factor [Phyllobacteriaceae]|jgi:DNA-binding transcriptional ArsR family regulator|uniref:Transcriptional regulator n=1 Tax=Mesorhizobium hungaricum TaxID=1566387 RepID=A0A1C2DFG0_9HYPH|nr:MULTISPECIES: metalloregulator ArsR/SmtB family transcription factor [Mesorhizobium]MBN9232329.1 helix-turn-helix transcriptional regulator [Mesorhizobium sp.]MDQ0329925.1 ArsR family transcriptional regulator [Mesorhizobium sp. YL-MeA3-2017]OCX13509.1 transcriptional regulator [Mesorhizobium hungaricum]